MEKAHRKQLLVKRLEFVKDLEPNDISGYLFQDGIITENDKEMIEAQQTRRERVEYLMDLLPRKGPKAFMKFCDVLTKSVMYEYLATLLKGQTATKSKFTLYTNCVTHINFCARTFLENFFLSF